MSDRLPSLQALRIFTTAARTLSFKRAAEALFLTPSAVSHQIRGLENELGVTLFHRTSRELVLTEAGEEYYKIVDSVFAVLSRGTAALRARRDDMGITLNVVHTFAANWLIRRLPDFHANHPDIDLVIRISASADPILLDPKRFQLAIRFGTGVEDWPGLAGCRLMACHILPVCSPAIAARLNAAADLSNETWLHVSMYSEAWSEWLDHSGLTGMRGKADRYYEDSEIRHRAAMSGLGVGMGIDCLVENYLANNQLVAPFPAPAPIRRAYWLLWPPEQADDPRVVLFRQWLMKSANML